VTTEMMRFMEMFQTSIGLEAKLSYQKDTMTYCGCLFAMLKINNCEVKYVAVPEITRRLSKLGLTTTETKDFRSSMASRLKGIMFCDKMPILRVFYKHYVTKDDDASYDVHSSFRPVTVALDWAEDITQFVDRHYGISGTELDEVEAYIHDCLKEMGSQPFSYDHPILTKMYNYYNTLQYDLPNCGLEVETVKPKITTAKLLERHLSLIGSHMRKQVVVDLPSLQTPKAIGNVGKGAELEAEVVASSTSGDSKPISYNNRSGKGEGVHDKRSEKTKPQRKKQQTKTVSADIKRR
jgi:hypothetical protein